jgi:hypothetical protein
VSFAFFAKISFFFFSSFFPKRNCAIKFSNGKRAYPALDVATSMEKKRGETTPTHKSSRIANSNCNYAKLKVSTHKASAISSENPFVMLALDKFQEAIVDEKNPP